MEGQGLWLWFCEYHPATVLLILGIPYNLLQRLCEKPQQTQTVDIFSFSVLLAKMLTNELPEKKDHECQMLKIAVEHPNFTGLVRHSLSIEHEQRLSVQALIVHDLLSDLVVCIVWLMLQWCCVFVCRSIIIMTLCIMMCVCVCVCVSWCVTLCVYA